MIIHIQLVFQAPFASDFTIIWIEYYLCHNNVLETNNDIDFDSIKEVDLIDVVNQLEKDIQSSGESYSFKSVQPDELIDELASFLGKIDRGSRLSNLLYRIDVNITKMQVNDSYYLALSKMIWNRVFQKVWFRKNY